MRDTRTIRSILVTASLGLVVAVMAPGSISGTEPMRVPPDRPWQAVDVALVLDTSDSMEGLIEAARLTLWDLVNEIASAEPAPRIRVAVVTFGSPSYRSNPGWVQVQTDLTGDLDLVAERLFDLGTGGGREYVSRAVLTAVDQLSWTPSAEAVKLLFVAGNEAADQDPEVSVDRAAYAARDRDISVHALFCGSVDQPDARAWRELVQIGRGGFAAIEHRDPTATLASPYDQRLAALSRQLNDTYVPLGEDGRRRVESLHRQDRNAAEAGAPAIAARARTKVTPRYVGGWDLVTAVERGERTVAEVDPADLPDELQGLSLVQLEEHVQALRDRRRVLRDEIASLSRERREHIVEQIEARGLDRSRSFAEVIRDAVREELSRRGFQLSGT